MTTALEDHYRKLAHMYETAPINAHVPSRIVVSEGRAEVVIDVLPQLFHAAGSLHGSIYFKALDDAAFFAANSVVLSNFVLTAHFEVDLLAPVTGKNIRAVGTLERQTGRKLEARSELVDPDGLVVARGTGLFIESRIALSDVPTYRLP